MPADVTVIFLYNPFGGESFARVLKQIVESADRAPRRIRLVYANPVEHDLVIASCRFIPTSRMSLGWRPGADWGITQKVQFYELKASA